MRADRRFVTSAAVSPKPSPSPKVDLIRLKVAFKSPSGLVRELTRSVGGGGVALQSKKAVPAGTRFLFELWAEGVEEPALARGEVVRVTPLAGGGYLLAVRYELDEDRRGLSAVLEKVFAAQGNERARRSARVPLTLRATEPTPYSPSFLIRDLSQSGLGVQIESPRLPKSVKVGAPFLLELSLGQSTLPLHGEVVWVASQVSKDLDWVSPSFGVAFGKLQPSIKTHLSELLHLKGMPSPPWKARINFGGQALSRMP